MQVKLSDLCNITMGQSPKSIYYNKEGSGIPFMQGCTTFGRLFPSIDTWTTSYNKLANPNDILFTVRAPVGDINIALTNIAIGRGLAALKPTSVSTKYLYYLLLSNKELFTNNSSGTVYDSINKYNLENTILNVHSYSNQLLIVDIIGSLDDKIENNNKIIDKLWQKLQLAHTDFKSKNELVEKNILELADIKYGKGIPTSEILKDGLYSVYGSNGIIGYLNNYTFKEHKIAISCRGNSSGIIHLTDENSTVTSNSLVLDFKNFDYTYYFFLEFMYKGLYGYKTGSAQPQITIDNLKILNLQVPKNINDYIKNINDSVEYTFCLKKENQKLFLLKQFYLKKFFG